MKTAIAIFVFVAAGSGAMAQGTNEIQEKACIINAASKLPSVPGLVILGSRVSPPNSAKIRRVELDIRAAGIETTMVVSCAPGIIVVEGFSK